MRSGEETRGERGAVAVTLLLLFVLGAGSAAGTRAIAAARGASEIGVAFEDRAVVARDARVERVTETVPGRVVADAGRAAAPRFRRLDGHAWPPPRAPGAEGR